jgi:hypothetical protein
MVCENCDAERSVTRVHNRALRRVNTLLRRKEQDLRVHADEMFFALCETNHSAEQAMREIWERAGLQGQRSELVTKPV